MEKRTCIECNILLTGRVDKKFCSDACRNAYNNRSNAEETSYIRHINQTLRKNRRILKAMNPEGKVKKKRDHLAKKGFDFNHITHVYKTKAGGEYRFCYEQGYLLLADDWVLLVQQMREE